MSGKARRGSGEGSVYQDKNRVWHAKLTVGRYRNGKPRYKEFKGKRKADVIARLNSYRREYGDLSLEPGANISFADYITRWIAHNGHNLRGEYAFQVQQKYHCSDAEANYIMVCHDCEDMGVQVNHAYAASVTGYDIEQLNRRSLDQYHALGTWVSQPLPGHEGKTLTYAQAQEVMKNRKEH